MSNKTPPPYTKKQRRFMRQECDDWLKRTDGLDCGDALIAIPIRKYRRALEAFKVILGDPMASDRSIDAIREALGFERVT